MRHRRRHFAVTHNDVRPADRLSDCCASTSFRASGARHDESGTGKWRKDRGRRQGAAQHAGFFVVPAASEKFGGDDDCACPRWGGPHQCDQAGERIQGCRWRTEPGGHALLISDVNAMGLSVAQGIVTSESFYWDLNDQTRQWSRRFMEKLPGQVPNMVHAGAYSAVLLYLRSVASAGTIDASVVVARMKQMPVNDFNNQNVRGRQDGGCFTPCISSA